MPRWSTLLAFARAEPRMRAVPLRPGRSQRPDRTLDYGLHALQQLDFYSAGDGQRPLLAFVHRGAGAASPGTGCTRT